jgi:hypothetical protein
MHGSAVKYIDTQKLGGHYYIQGKKIERRKKGKREKKSHWWALNRRVQSLLNATLTPSP